MTRSFTEGRVVPDAPFAWTFVQPFPAGAWLDEPLRASLPAGWLRDARADAERRGIDLPGEPTVVVRWLYETMEYDSEGRTWTIVDSYEVDGPEGATIGYYRMTWPEAVKAA